MLQSDKVAAFFLQTELNTALTFASIAIRNKSSNDRMARNRSNARVAHDAIERFKGRTYLTAVQQAEFDEKFATLKNYLRELGEVI